ncbi:MAG: MmcQ/YjbR family DNA-binding protein [Cytophagales bacterium]|nr:MmcQ/YjbR family DNA-binding protein [Cytophagales bacterium]
MVTETRFKKAALQLPQVVELPHFEKLSFRVKNKIFATLNTTTRVACLKFNETDQSVFCLNPAFTPVPNKWGKQGWTFVDLKKISAGLLNDALHTAYTAVSSGARNPKRN